MSCSHAPEPAELRCGKEYLKLFPVSSKSMDIGKSNGKTDYENSIKCVEGTHGVPPAPLDWCKREKEK